jgi:hypothetical protein
MQRIDITDLFKQFPALQTLDQFITGVEIGDWKTYDKTDRETNEKIGETTSCKVVILLKTNVWLANKNGNSHGADCYMTIYRNDDGSLKIKAQSFQPEGKAYKRWSEKLEGFYAAGEEWKELREWGPTLVKLLVKEGMIK